MELKWLADYIVNGLVMIKHNLGIDDCDTVADTLQALWDTLDFLNLTDQIDHSGKAVNNRFILLR
jgi:hypothetical protein